MGITQVSSRDRHVRKSTCIWSRMRENRCDGVGEDIPWIMTISQELVSVVFLAGLDSFVVCHIWFACHGVSSLKPTWSVLPAVGEKGVGFTVCRWLKNGLWKLCGPFSDWSEKLFYDTGIFGQGSGSVCA